MSFDLALRLTETLLGFAFLQASLEHILHSQRDRILFTAQAVVSLALFSG
jgi:hypothetical protein